MRDTKLCPICRKYHNSNKDKTQFSIIESFDETKTENISILLYKFIKTSPTQCNEMCILKKIKIWRPKRPKLVC